MCRNLILAVAALVAIASSALAQRSGSTGYGSSGYGSSGFSSSGGFSSNSGFSSGMSGIGSGGGALGSGGSFRPNNSTFGSASSLSTPQSGVTANPFEAARVDPRAQGQVTSSAQQPGQSRNATNAGNRRQQGPVYGQGNFGQGNFGQGNFGQGNFNQGFNGAAGTQRTTIPVTRIAFPVLQRPDAAVVTSTNQTFNTRIVPGTGYAITMQPNGVAVLRGEADSEHAANLAMALVRMEPGVRSVTNEMTIRTPTGAPPAVNTAPPAVNTAPTPTPPPVANPTSLVPVQPPATP